MEKNSKKLSPAKLISIVFCIITLIVFVVLVVIKVYTGGQIKTVSNVYAALTHDIYEDYKVCFKADSDYLSEKEFEALRSDYEQKWGEDFHLKADYSSRKKLDDGKYMLTIKLTVYNETDSNSEDCGFVMVKQNGKWVISE